MLDDIFDYLGFEITISHHQYQYIHTINTWNKRIYQYSARYQYFCNQM